MIALVDASAIECGLVEEDIGAAVVLLDEPEALEIVETINNAAREREAGRVNFRLEAAASATGTTSATLRAWVGVGFENSNRVSSRTLGPHTNGELNAVALAECLIANGGTVYEEILFAAITLNKTETLLRVIPLDSSRRHRVALPRVA
jgi:hypothetical protein